MPLIFDGNEPKNITYNGNEVKKVIYNGVTVWEKNANLLQINDMNIESHGYSLSVQNGVITLNGSQTSSFNGELNFDSNVSDLPLGNYICKISHISSDNNQTVAVKLITTSYVQVVNTNFYNSDQEIHFSLNTPAARLYLYIAPQWSYQNKKFKIEIFNE